MNDSLLGIATLATQTRERTTTVTPITSRNGPITSTGVRSGVCGYDDTGSVNGTNGYTDADLGHSTMTTGYAEYHPL